MARTMSGPMAFPRVACASWDELFDRLEGMEGWIFRGHSSANWLLKSTLERRTPEGESGFFNEFNIIREFQGRAHNSLGAHQIPSQPGEWLSLMQHFGAPTRLVDFTRSPFVAAYFA